MSNFLNNFYSGCNNLTSINASILNTDIISNDELNTLNNIDTSKTIQQQFNSLVLQKGDTGATGQKGDTGQSAIITVGSTTTGLPNTNAIVTNSGTSSNAILNFTIPKGQDGSTIGLDGISYNSSNTTTTIANNVIISKDLTVSGISNLYKINLTNTFSIGSNSNISVNGQVITPQVLSYIYSLSSNAQDQLNTVVKNLIIGSITTLSAGSQATASITFSNSTCTLNLGIPQGQQGQQGNDSNLSAVISGVAGGVIGAFISSSINDLTNFFSNLLGIGQTATLTPQQTLQAQIQAIFNMLNALDARVSVLEGKCLYLSATPSNTLINSSLLVSGTTICNSVWSNNIDAVDSFHSINIGNTSSMNVNIGNQSTVFTPLQTNINFYGKVNFGFNSIVGTFNQF